jgi:cell division protein FtsQ
MKRRKMKRAKILAFTAIVLVLALLGASVWAVYFSTLLVTKRVTVEGIHALTRTQVSLAAQVPLGVPLARQHLDAIAQRTTTLRAVETATVRRSWPSTITVAVVERRPVLAVRQPDGYVIVDKSGVAYQTQQVLPPEVLLTDIDPGNASLLRDAAVAATALPPKLRVKVNRMTASNGDTIALILESGRTVTWGSASDSQLKAQVVMALLKQRPKSIDVSSPHNPAVR